LTGGPHDQEEKPDFAELSNRVYRLCLSLLGSEVEASDAGQEAMVRAWSRRGSRRAEVSWWTWCGGFAVRVCREMWRHRQRDRRVSELDVHELNPAVVREGLSQDDTTRLHVSVMQLPRRQREVTILRFFAGLSVQEAAQVLGCPPGTVKSNLHKAIQTLRRSLADRDKLDELQGI